MIKAIEFKNVKGQSGIQELTGMDVFIGRNGAGKTTRIQSLGLAMLGHVPGHNKTPADTFKLATGENMSVGLRLDDFQFTRAFGKDEKRNNKTGEVTISIKETLAVSPGKGEKNDTQKKARIVSEIDSFPVMMDFGEFLSLSDAKRRDFIYSLSTINSDAWTKERIDDYLVVRLITPELKENNPEQYDVMWNLIEKALDQFPEGFAVSDGLQAMIDWVSTEKSIWDRKQKDAQGAVRQFAEMKNELAETDRNIVTLKEELETLQKQNIEAEKRISADVEKKKAIDKRTARIAELNGLITELQNTSIDASTADLDKQIAEHHTQLKTPPVIDEQMKPLKERQAEFRKQRKELEKQHQEISQKISEAHATVSALEQALQTTQKLAGHCIVNPQFIKCDKNFSGFGGHVTKKKEEAGKVVSELRAEAKKVKQQIDVLEKEEIEVENKQAELLRQVQEINARNTSINKSITELTNAKNERLKAATDRENKLKLYQDEVSRLLSEPVEAVTGTDLLEKQVAGIRTRIDELKNTISGKEKAKQAILMMQQSVIENRKAEYHSACLKLICEALGPKGVQGELVKEILEPIRQDIRHNLKFMGFDYQPFFQTESETGKEIFQFGWINEKGHHVNFDALSTGQQTVFLAAMMVTIIDRAKPKLRILVMDDLNHLDRKNFQMLIDGLSKIRGKLDNVILAGAIEFEFAAEGWSVTNLSAEALVDTDYVVIDDSEVKQSA